MKDIMVNDWAQITIKPGSPDGTKGFGDMLYAEFTPYLGMNLRTKTGRRRLRRFIDRLDGICNLYDRRYDK